MGGRGGKSKGGKGKSGGGSSREDTQVKAITENSVFPAGDYAFDGETVSVEYRMVGGNTVKQVIDGMEYDGGVTVLTEGKDVGKYRAVDDNGRIKTTGSATEASKHAFGTPRQAGFKKKK